MLWSSLRLWDHPRSRGEYTPVRSITSSPTGSSPLSRGIRRPLALAIPSAGIIPALAGNTPVACMFKRGTGDHPRSRGEYPEVSECRGRGTGSSPLSRGIHGQGDLKRKNQRIIPALAGNTSSGSWLARSSRGSSPLSRGILGGAIPPVRFEGIIPALAGNTSNPSDAPMTSWDHPRSRGEYGYDPDALYEQYGSSPLSRGIRLTPSRAQTS